MTLFSCHFPKLLHRVSRSWYRKDKTNKTNHLTWKSQQCSQHISSPPSSDSHPQDILIVSVSVRKWVQIQAPRTLSKHQVPEAVFRCRFQIKFAYTEPKPYILRYGNTSHINCTTCCAACKKVGKSDSSLSWCIPIETELWLLFATVQYVYTSLCLSLYNLSIKSCMLCVHVSVNM